ncbi:MAG TPA: VOC family protein [Propionibacteriaceae bacterium]|jgi:predicted enzyme related to lactoylglutathione lyase|nr:VOC family protein [Propionibacteriaceae bacterium]
MNSLRTYPEGVTCWVDLESGDVQAAAAFYGQLFGWTLSEVTPSGYQVAQLNGKDAAGIGAQLSADESEPRSPAWNTYIAVSDLDRAASRVQAAGGRVTQPASDPGHGARTASCVDTGGVPFRLWQATGRPGAQVVNTPGGWNFSDLHVSDVAVSIAFYTSVFGWRFDELGFATMIRLPGYGDHLAATSDPDIHERQSGVSAPPGFADAIGWLAPVGDGERPHWHVSFTVDDRDRIAAVTERLGGTVMALTEGDWTRDALIRDPHGAVFTASQFAPQST